MSFQEELEAETKQEKTNRIKRTVIIVIVALVATILCIGAINVSKKKKPSGGPGGRPGMGGFGGPGAGGGTVTSVKTVVAESVVLHDYVTTNGDVETQRSIEVFPSIGGKVIQTLVSLGSQVKAGDVLAYIDPSEPGSYYAKSPVTAPISGSIISTPLKTGQKVSTSSVVTKIGDIDNLQITASVPERYIADLSLGLKAEISFEAYDDVVFPATVVRISPVVDAATRTKEIILHFDSPDPRINAGMFAKVKLYTVDYAGKIAIQQDAVVSQNDDRYLYVVKEDNTVEKRLVTLGKNVAGYYQILTGINNGETVVVEGMLTLSDGGKVKDITNGVVREEKPEDKPEGKPAGKDGKPDFDKAKAPEVK